MNDVDRRLIQDKQDQLLTVAKKAMAQQEEIKKLNGEVSRLRQVLRRIAAYSTPDELRQNAEGDYGLDYDEALEMSYENIQQEAMSALQSSAL